jgi:hypothetical protein
MLAPSNSDRALGQHADAPIWLLFRWWTGIQRLATSQEQQNCKKISSVNTHGRTALQFQFTKTTSIWQNKLSTMTIYFSVLTEIWATN